MEYDIFSFRHAETILKADYFLQYQEITKIINSISESSIKKYFLLNGKTHKSVSRTLNVILKEKFIKSKWNSESKIFKDKEFESDTWRLDFAKNDISLEVGFNHATVASWNLLKPTIAGELNHVQKDINTKIGVIITATSELKKSGGFDNAIGTFENYKSYIKALNNILTVPILLIGLKGLKSFNVIVQKGENNKNVGIVRRIAKR